MARASDIRIGVILRINGDLLRVEDFSYRSQGNLRAFYQARLRNIKSGKVLEYRFRTDEDVELANVDINNYHYLHEDGDSLVLVDIETKDQRKVLKALFGDTLRFLKKGMDVTVAFENDKPITGTIPKSVTLEVINTGPDMQDDIVVNKLNTATLETGAEIEVPFFVNTGDKVIVDTASGRYMDRAWR